MANGNFGGGNGALGMPYLIEDAQDLDAIRNEPDIHYKIVADIDVSEYVLWTPIANFSGSLDGAGHTIYNLNNAIFDNVTAGATVSSIHIIADI